jgi:DNA polymerase-3 subunit epsilon
MSYLFFDTETTGLPLRKNAHHTDVHVWPRIVSMSWAYCADPGVEPVCKYKIVRPEGFTIPPDAARVHGITTERALSEGVKLAAVLQEFAADMQANRPSLLVAHNMQFDRPVILAEYIRAGIPEPISRFPTFCTMLSTTEICRLQPVRFGQHKWPKLEELHYHLFRMEFSAGHDARADVRACAQCFFRLRELGLISV